MFNRNNSTSVYLATSTNNVYELREVEFQCYVNFLRARTNYLIFTDNIICGVVVLKGSYGRLFVRKAAGTMNRKLTVSSNLSTHCDANSQALEFRASSHKRRSATSRPWDPAFPPKSPVLPSEWGNSGTDAKLRSSELVDISNTLRTFK